MLLFTAMPQHVSQLFFRRFNQNHFTRIYPDFSPKSWGSGNFDPTLYWATGCQLVALNFQTPGTLSARYRPVHPVSVRIDVDRPMNLNAGRFAVNGGSVGHDTIITDSLRINACLICMMQMWLRSDA